MENWIEVLLWWLAFGGSHALLSSTTVRGSIIQRTGDGAFAGLYSLVAFATFVPLVMSWSSARHSGPALHSLAALPGIREASIALSVVAMLGVVLGLVQPSPASLTAGKSDGITSLDRGVMRITRHPMFMGIGLWGLAHCLVNPFATDLVFFGGFAVYALVGCAHQDSRKRAGADDELANFFNNTSLLPFAAVAARRNKLVLSEFPLAALAGALFLSWLVFWLHTALPRWL